MKLFPCLHVYVISDLLSMSHRYKVNQVQTCSTLFGGFYKIIIMINDKWNILYTLISCTRISHTLTQKRLTNLETLIKVNIYISLYRCTFQNTYFSVTCPEVQAPANGSYSGEGTTREFACNDGYVLEGSPQIQCGYNGEWNASTPDCFCE